MVDTDTDTVRYLCISSQGLKGGPEVSVMDAVGLMKGDSRTLVVDVRETRRL
jgi:hypothetical protein